MSTSFDCSSPTINKPVLERVVCRNTFDAAMAEPQSAIKTRHSTRFNPKQVADEIAKIAQSYDKFKLMGDALAQATMAREEVSKFFKELVDIPFDAKREDVSTRKMNIFEELSTAYGTSLREANNNNAGTAWPALQAVTRYVDHDRTVRNVADFAGGEHEARFAAATFGSGNDLKGKAWSLLMPRIADKVAA
jgi:hypothetical protein